ncbi:enolase C-terminal domain-like protein [Microbacterium dauci]|uniref:glucarate dehydratase n=1 Tax=Microbacterium dauci TaxID=3048008 RepID=A0ABT6ZCC9_9MICO|nr:enolase C-terminal domain-like protein [Microbacterium sp. LX3-4]MDJ1113815.1 enolase C-terminal domain-like protein [Microbacterium sp. LX3-4]
MSRITHIEVIPLAFSDPPLLNTWGVHEPLALRTLVVIRTEDGTTGLGEAGGDITLLRRLEAIAPRLIGTRVDAPSAISDVVRSVLGPDCSLVERNVAQSPFEVAVTDAWARLEGIRVVDLLGGAVRQRVDYAGYLFYKWPGHPGAADDEWGRVLTADEVVRLARTMVESYGFGSLKLKAGVFPPDQEIDAIQALHAALPNVPLRIDPNGAWTEGTALRAAQALEGSLDYLEDPVLSIPAMARVRASTTLPLASNMIVNTLEDLDAVVAASALDIVLADHHYWGGLRSALDLARECAAAGLGVSMHSNSHLGVSLAAMTHVAAASDAISYASDTHFPWNRDDDIVADDTFTFDRGALSVPDGPGLGVELRPDVVERLHRAYLESGRTIRDDTGYMRSVDPDYDARLPRF